MHGQGTFLDNTANSSPKNISLTVYWGSSKSNIGSKTLKLCQKNIQTLKKGNGVLE